MPTNANENDTSNAGNETPSTQRDIHEECRDQLQLLQKNDQHDIKAWMYVPFDYHTQL